MYFKFGVDSFIWTEDFKEKDLWIISKAKEMGFTGVILTDDLSMEAIAGQDFGLEHSAYVQAFLAGNDILLCSDYQAAYQDLLEAVEAGVIPQEMLDHAVFRILAWKGTLGLM